MMNNKYMKEFPRALAIGFSVFCVIVLINFLNGNDVAFDDRMKSTLLYTLLYSVSLHLANITFVISPLDNNAVMSHWSMLPKLGRTVTQFGLQILLICFLFYF